MPKPPSFGLLDAPSDYDYSGYEPDWDEDANGDDPESECCDFCGRTIGVGEGEAHPDGCDWDAGGFAICEDCRAERSHA